MRVATARVRSIEGASRPRASARPGAEEEPHMLRRTLVATIAASALLISMTAGTALARPVHVFEAVLTGGAEVPGPGDADAIGHVVIMTEPANDRVCWV